MFPRASALAAATFAAVVVAGCATPLRAGIDDSTSAPASAEAARPERLTLPTTSLPVGSATVATPSVPAMTVPPVVSVEYRVENRSPDPAVGGFAAVAAETLSSPSGWQQAGFVLTQTPEAPHLVVLAEPDEAQSLCLPYDVYRRYSCQNGPLVVLNAQRWREATPEWTGDLGSYRQMLVNHEFGHLLGQRHVACGPPDRPAPVMCQQSTELAGALANPWPLPEEIDRASRHDQPIAPAFGE